MKLLGTALHPDDKRYVLSTYVHSFTGNHFPQWAIKPMPNGGRYPLQFRDDSEWLAHTWFSVRDSDERIDKRVKHCHPDPTWPFNLELRKPANQ